MANKNLPLSHLSLKRELHSMLREPKKDSKQRFSSYSSKKRSKDTQRSQIIEIIEPDPIPTTKKIFLYVHLQSIVNIPKTGNRMLMKLTHKANKVSKLEDHYSEETAIDLKNLDVIMPTFSITIEQDSIEDLNSLSDNPLMITCYEVIPPPLKGEEDTSDDEGDHVPEAPHYEPIAQGSIDLLQCFSKKRCLALNSTFLYPIVNTKSTITLPTIKTLWQMYTLMPLMRELSFCNIAFITFESIYNAPSDIMDNCEGLMADLYFQSKIPNAKKNYEKVLLCSFSLFTRTIIGEQNVNIKWENLKDGAININHLGLYTGAKVSVHKLFERLLCTEGAKLNFHNIEPQEDEALVCNSVHRHILTKEISDILEEVVSFNRQQILVQIYKSNKPEEILMHGNLDLSVMLYPRVNACRFAVQLHPSKHRLKKKNPSPATAKKKERSVAASTSIAATASTTTAASVGAGESHHNKEIHSLKNKTPFAIVAICLLSPITEGDDQFSMYNDNHLTKEKLKRCLKISKEMALLPLAQVAEENYKSFDEMIGELIHYIITRRIQSTDEGKNYFCCQLANLSNRILKLIATDINRRFPTNTNIEFSKLMTTVYQELTERVYSILKNCKNINLELCFLSDSDQLAKIINFINISKYMYEVGDVEIGDLLFNKLWHENVNNKSLHFFKFLYDVEMQNFADAKTYICRPPTEKWLAMDYFVEWIDMYIKYMENLQHEQSYNQALENLLIALQDIIDRYPTQTDGWILMHCLYRMYSYLPGVSFSRWKYENLYEKLHKSLPPIPRSRWELYNNYRIYFHTEKSYHFYEVFQHFVELGLYKFAEFVFREIGNECAEVERHLVMTTLKILLKEDNKKMTTKWFEVEKSSNAVELRAFQAQVNGNLEYFEDAIDEALQSYEHILISDDLLNYENFELSMLRYGYQMFEQRQYQNALKAFDKCFMGGNCMVANILMGKTLYKADCLVDAETFFARSTKYKIHMPNVWAYLALINLRLGNNFKALEFWKYAKINPDNVISDEILEELQKIQYKDVFLYVDKPE